MYVADRANYRVRKIDIASLQVTTVAGDGTDGNIDHQTDPLQARIGLMTHISLDPSGALFIGTTNRLRKLQGNSVSTVAGGDVRPSIVSLTLFE